MVKKIVKNLKKKKKVSKKTTVKEILDMEKGEDILKKYNFPCLSCPMASFEIELLQVGDVSQMYGLDIEKIIKELNNI